MKEFHCLLLLFIISSLICFAKSITDERILSECHPNCLECSGPPKDSLHMNCLSCQDGFYLYKSNNCLNCSKYVNFEQTECIEVIPDGYYLEDEEIGTLGKCHELCKTCDGPPMPYGMQCIECKYEEEGFVPTYESDCPDGIDDDEEEYPRECPREQPILVIKSFCLNYYCSQKEKDEGICELHNSIIKTQWINNIKRFGEGEISNVCLDFGDNGELFLFAQEKDLNNDRWLYMYGIDKEQMPILYDETGNISFYKKMHIPYDIVIQNIKLVKNFENDNLFLISTQINKDMYVIDYINNKTNIHKFNDISFSSKMSEIIYIKKLTDIYFTNFIICKNNNNDCYGFLRKFKFFTKNNDIKNIKEYTMEERINLERNFICMESYNSNYIQCLYTSFEENIYKLDLIDVNSVQKKYEFIIEQNMNKANNIIESMIKLNNDSFIIVYSLKNNIIRVLLKSIKYDYKQMTLDLYNYIEEVPYIDINTNNKYIFEEGNSSSNSISTINENKFAILLSAFKNLSEINFDDNVIIIYIFTVFNEHKNINMRKYSINLKLYNMFVNGKILGYTFGNFLGALVELTSPDNINLTNAGFITFGYTNIVKDYEIYDTNFMPNNSFVSYPIKVRNYINEKLENNLFGYVFEGAKILSLIDPRMGYFFIGNNYKLLIGQIVKIDYEIHLEVYHNCTPGNYSIEFAGVASGPKYDDLEKYSEELWSYPNGTNISERKFYKEDTIVGRKVIYKFELRKHQIPKLCYLSCLTCDEYFEHGDNQRCTSCKPSFYFINGTQNCYNYVKPHYYFDEITKKYYPCYKDCLTCDKKENSTYNMNCLTCPSNLYFYPKAKNCLKCPKYINYLQTECISFVPEGFYVLNETLGLIEPCHKLCKTCSKGSVNDTQFHMNCDICLYENKNYIPTEPGDCPESPDQDDEVDPINNQCPKDKPILKFGKCKNIFCTKLDFDYKICNVYNDIVKIQWFNNINNFEKDASNVKYVVGENGEIFLFAQERNVLYNINIYLYGFDKYNEGYFYNNTRKEYSTYKELILKNNIKYIEKVKYVEINKKPFLLNLIKDNKMYLIDIDTNEQFIHTYPNVPYSIDNFQKYINSNNEYLYDYIICNNDICNINFIKFQLKSKSDFDIVNNIQETIRIKPDTKLICINNILSSNYILCKYNLLELIDDQNFINKHVLSIFDSNTFELKKHFILDDYFIPEKQVLDDMLSIDERNSNFIIAYSTSQNIIQILFKTFKNEYNELTNAIEGVPSITINEDLDYYFKGNVYSNNLCKLDNDNFALLIKTYQDKNLEDINTGLLVVSIRIFKFSKVIVRYYHMNFNLYNINLKGNVLGYNLNGFLGALLEYNLNNKEIGKAAFITFGFIKTADDVPLANGTFNLIEKRENIKVSDYILDVENNLFGYELIGVKILNLPETYKVGGFVNLKDSYTLIKINDIIKISSELRFTPSINAIYGNYSISFAGIVKEPSEQIAINIDDKSEYYPNNSTQYDYTLKTFMGKKFTYNFALTKIEPKCFQNCEECLFVSDDIENQSCLKCKPGFYFINNTRNCFDKIDSKYYFDDETKQFYPCYKDCYTCKTKEINTTYMNCLSCSSPFKLYEKTKNCLNCYKYANYDQTDCLDELPDGYYVLDKEKGIIDKCYKLCKTCSKKEFLFGKQLYMNCDTCLFKNNSKVTLEGNCPEYEEPEEKEKEKEIEEDGNTLIIVISIVFSVVVIFITLVTLYFTCYKKGKCYKGSSEYLSKERKNIAFEDDLGIN